MRLLIEFLLLLGFGWILNIFLWSALSRKDSKNKKEGCCKSESDNSCHPSEDSEDTVDRYFTDCKEEEEDSAEILAKWLIENEELNNSAKEERQDFIDFLDQTAEIERIAKGNFKVGDCFLETEGYDGDAAVRMIKELRSNGDWSYEYCPYHGLEPYTISLSSDGLSKEDISLELESGSMIFCGTFNL